MFEHGSKIVMMFLYLFLSVLVGGCTGTNETDSGRVLALQEYVDPKGFFSVIPPYGWTVKEYPDDVRGKVSFQLSRSTSLSILTNGVDYSDFESLKDELRGTMRNAGIRSQLIDSELNGIPAVERDFVIQGSKILMIDFLRGKVAHNLMYTTTRSEFDKHLDTVMASLATYQPRHVELTEEEFLENILAKDRRLGRLFIDMGEYEQARFYIEEGLSHSNTDELLLQLEEELESKTNRDTAK